MNTVLGYCCVVCGQEVATRDLRYTCGRCGGNLQVVHDYVTLARQSFGDEPHMGRYHAFMGVSEGFRPGRLVRTTPLIPVTGRIPRLGDLDVQIKDETGHPSASFKDRASYVALAKASQWGHKRVVAASTGNAGASLACLAASTDIEATIFVPASAPQAKLVQLEAFGADLRRVDGDYDQAFDQSLAETKRHGWFNRNTGYNPWTREGKKSVAFEIFEQTKGMPPEWIVIPVGDGNILTGTWKGFAELVALGWLEQAPKLLAVQARGSDAIATAVERRRRPNAPDLRMAIQPVHADTVADSISVSLPRDGVAAVKSIEESRGEVIRVHDDAILDAVLETARATGVFLEPAAAAAIAGLTRALEEDLITPTGPVIVLATGSGLKDIGALSRHLSGPTLRRA